MKVSMVNDEYNNYEYRSRRELHASAAGSSGHSIESWIQK